MLKNYLKIALRNRLKHKSFSVREQLFVAAKPPGSSTSPRAGAVLP